MNTFSTFLLLSLLCCGICHRVLPKEINRHHLEVKEDEPLQVVVTEVGGRYAVFKISGSNTVKGLPVVDLSINYTIEGPKDEIKALTLNSSQSNGKLEEIIKIINLMPGHYYTLQFSAVNSKGEKGPSSNATEVLLLPPIPDITIDHPSLRQLKVMWGSNKSGSETYYLLTVEKKSALGCGFTVNITSCFGNKYTLDDLDVGEVYRLSLRAYNPSGFSDPVVISYPIE